MTEPLCEMRMKYIEEKITELKESVHESRDLIKEVVHVTDSIEDSNKELSDAVRVLKDKEERLEAVVSELNQTAKTLGGIVKFAKPLVFALLALGLSAVPNGLEIIKLLAGLF
jgi:DNA repair ATPase RecN